MFLALFQWLDEIQPGLKEPENTKTAPVCLKGIALYWL